ncbi:HNH endonuclease [Nocardioides agariphilus]|uniref:HNH endonuclease n=1 Tax=Nocardioides agariphilus TaxID=433664 RepID=A0A930YJH7_9ACTN|nr:HNH endonuclease [Nocardioides agariphilus]
MLSLDLATLADLATRGVIGPVDAGRWGVATSDLVKAWVTDWLGVDTRIVVRPVLDLTDPTTVPAVDGHDPPDPMAWYVRLRDPVCVFPGCTRASRDCDLDHIEAYLPIAEGGPPGQTHPDNLAPLCRRHHRVKTHARWSYHRLPDDGYQWTTPTGRVIDTPPPRRYRR